MNTYICTICGYIYDEAAGIPNAGIPPGTTWDKLPDGWVCPLCGAAKSQFRMQEKTSSQPIAAAADLDESALSGMSVAQLSALCSNLGRGCEKQYLSEEAKLFRQLAEYFTAQIPPVEQPSAQQLHSAVTQDLDHRYPEGYSIARTNGDRGALRALTWSEKVSRMLSAILDRYATEGEALLENTNIYVCEVCGFIYVGDEPPALCPVCKVPSWKLQKVERR